MNSRSRRTAESRCTPWTWATAPPSKRGPRRSATRRWTCLINNAGILGGKTQTLEQIDFDSWIDAFKVMTIGPFRVVQAFLKNLKAATDAKVMTVTSQLAASPGRWAAPTPIPAPRRREQGHADSGSRLEEGEHLSRHDPSRLGEDRHGRPRRRHHPEESASGIRKVIAGLSQADTGKFYKWNGDVHPW